MNVTPSVDQRVVILERARMLKMARSAHAYVRGNTVKFYEWLAASPVAARLPHAPAIWICGDCHLGNLGPVADGRGSIAIQIRDLDQTVIGNPAHDLIRLGLSLATAARGSDLPGVTTARMIEQMVDGYASALRDPEDGDAGPEPDAVRTVRRRALGRRWHHLARERIGDPDPTIPLGKRFWAIEPGERDALATMLHDPAIARTILSLDNGKARPVRLVDAAYWMKGCSSLGLLRYAAIIAVRGAHEREDYALVDIKEAAAPLAPPAAGATMPSDPAERIVAGARALSPHLGERMIAARMRDRPIFVRELMPQDLKLEVEQFTQAQAIKAARYLAYVVGRAHGRQMEKKVRREWRTALRDHRRAEIDAPSWLWKSVVDLAGSHEAGYLDHCRRFVLSEAA